MMNLLVLNLPYDEFADDKFMLREPYPSHHNGLFSPLLVLRDFAAREADQYRCYPNSTRLLTFSM